ncbi:MAG: T9SS type A sorting domain-containing protein [Bacteroidia bacterium]|nr:T9SS type A sorting domain-containing protein [Bacteroidia bacterium]
MRLYISILLTSMCLVSFSQVFNSPESVEYDQTNGRWLVGQNGSGEIHIISPLSNTLIPFATGIASGPHGLEVLGNVLYVCDGSRILGYDLSSANQVFNVNTGAAFLNGLTSDGGNFLFATDFTNKRIYRINVSNGTFNIMVTTTYTPNGIIYDAPNNRCVFVNWGTSARVQAMSMTDSTVTTLYTNTVSNIDGITRDPAGYWYITTWGGNALRRFDPAFSAAPVSVMTGLSSPADIDISSAGDSIGIPNSGTLNNVVFYTNITTSVAENASSSVVLYPNPAEDVLTILLDEPVLNGKLELYDVCGNQLLLQTVNGFQFRLDRGTLPAGMYIVKLLSFENRLLYTGRAVLK